MIQLGYFLRDPTPQISVPLLLSLGLVEFQEKELPVSYLEDTCLFVNTLGAECRRGSRGDVDLSIQNINLLKPYVFSSILSPSTVSDKS